MFPIPVRSRTRLQAGGQRRIPPYCQQADGISQASQSPCAEISAVSDYLNWFEDAFFLFTMRIFDSSQARANTNPKKIYCIDHSLVRSVSSGILVNAGYLLENLVFTALRRITSRIFHYRSAAGREVDFLALLPDGARMLVQVCESLAAPQTMRRHGRVGPADELDRDPGCRPRDGKPNCSRFRRDRSRRRMALSSRSGREFVDHPV